MQPQAVPTHTVLPPHLRPPPVRPLQTIQPQATRPQAAQAQAVAPHLRHLTPEQRQHLSARALARQTQATPAPARQPTHVQPRRGTTPPPPQQTHLELEFTYIRQFHHTHLEDHIFPYIAPNLVCPCQLSGHQCKGQPTVKKTYDGRSWMCGLEEVCTKQVSLPWLNSRLVLTWHTGLHECRS